ncbi:MAG: sigma-70 family RNA polymerase sigma factor [Christensenellaceae bacterium]
MLSVNETYELIKLAKNGDESAKEKLLLNNTSLLKSIIKRFNKKGVEYDDLYQLASLGFFKAILNFDESFNVRFSTYAVPMIIGEIKRFMRDDGQVKVSRIIKNLSYKINQYVESRVKSGFQQPTIEELSEVFNVDKDDVVLALGSAKPVLSLNESVNDDGDKPVELGDKIAGDFLEDDMLDRIMLKQFISELGEKEKRIIELRYFFDKTQQEIANELNVSQVQVSRLEAQTLKKLKSKM